MEVGDLSQDYFRHHCEAREGEHSDEAAAACKTAIEQAIQKRALR
jgi:hypothetical protein